MSGLHKGNASAGGFSHGGRRGGVLTGRAACATVASMNANPSPYDLPELYDQIFEGFDFDIPFWRATSSAAGGPVLDLGCGTGRVLMPLLEAGVDADGVDLYEPMLERARAKAEAGGFHPLLK